MPDARLQRTRETLDRTYQFGHSGHPHVFDRFDPVLRQMRCTRCGKARSYRDAVPDVPDSWITPQWLVDMVMPLMAKSGQ